MRIFESISSQFIFLQFASIVLSIGQVHEDIIQWWNEKSIQQPLKCNLNPMYHQHLHDIGTLSSMIKQKEHNPILYSQPCHYEDQLEQSFIYDGEKNYFHISFSCILFSVFFEGHENNGYFEGPGKLKIINRLPLKHSPGQLKSENKVGKEVNIH